MRRLAPTFRDPVCNKMHKYSAGYA